MVFDGELLQAAGRVNRWGQYGTTGADDDGLSWVRAACTQTAPVEEGAVMPGVGGAGSRLLRTVAPCLKRNNSRADTASGAGAAQQPPPTAQNNAGFVRARDGAALERFRQTNFATLKPTSLGFGPEVDQLIHKSPILCGQIRDIKAIGFRIVKAKPGFGSYMNPATLTVGIDPRQDRDNIVSHIAHEVGHAIHRTKGFIAPTTSQEAYCHAMAWDEGGATLNQYKIQDELRSNGENFSPSNLSHFDDFFKPVYNAYLQHKDEDKVKNELGYIYANKLTAQDEVAPGKVEINPYKKIWERYYAELIMNK
jgi:type VI secretion system secreted protein VgrG